MLEVIENLNFFYKPFIALALSGLLLFTHSFKFKFLLNRNTVYLTMMLPVIILILTQTIATNLYLSLGLIGALSIVRYRTPVKSQYELAYLFALIAIGIVSGVNPKYAIFLTSILIILPIIYEIILKFFPSISNELRFYSDGRAQLNATFNKANIESIENNPKNGRLIRVDSNAKENQSNYLFSFDSLEDAYRFKKALKVKPESLSISNS